LFGTVPLTVFIVQSFFVKNLAATPESRKTDLSKPDSSGTGLDPTKSTAPTHLIRHLEKPGKIGR